MTRLQHVANLAGDLEAEARIADTYFQYGRYDGHDFVMRNGANAHIVEVQRLIEGVLHIAARVPRMVGRARVGELQRRLVGILRTHPDSIVLLLAEALIIEENI